jgi:RNA polymerase sigma factor (sigma-70 family)
MGDIDGSGRSADRRRSDAEERFGELLRQYGTLLRRTVIRLCPTSLGVAADEIEQDARLRLWRAVLSERHINEPASYLYRIAAAAAIDAVRRVRARRESQLALVVDSNGSEMPTPDRSPEQLATDRQLSERVHAALSALAVNRRRAVALHLRGFTSVEIGRQLGWSEPKARNLTYRGLEDLRVRLKAAGIGFAGQK